jgi:hypothetical protein
MELFIEHILPLLGLFGLLLLASLTEPDSDPFIQS